MNQNTDYALVERNILEDVSLTPDEIQKGITGLARGLQHAGFTLRRKAGGSVVRMQMAASPAAF